LNKLFGKKDNKWKNVAIMNIIGVLCIVIGVLFGYFFPSSQKESLNKTYNEQKFTKPYCPTSAEIDEKIQQEGLRVLPLGSKDSPDDTYID
jgi:hypothetical protein